MEIRFEVDLKLYEELEKLAKIHGMTVDEYMPLFVENALYRTSKESLKDV